MVPSITPCGADSARREERNLRRLAEIVAANPLPVVIWNGSAADMPQLRKAAQRLKLGQALHTVESRHLDLFLYVTKAVRFPIPQLPLDQLASYFGIPRVSRICDGLEALSLYQQYWDSRDEERRVALKTDLLQYNPDDLEALLAVVERIAGLQSDSKKVAAEALSRPTATR